MKPTRLVDLSWPLRPGREARLLEIERIDSADVTHSEQRGEGWYIMHNVQMTTHLGTHVEVPYHALPEGEDFYTSFINELDFGEMKVRGS